MPAVLDHRAALRQHGIQRGGKGARVQPAVHGLVGARVVGRSFGQAPAGFRAPTLRRSLTIQQLQETRRGRLRVRADERIHPGVRRLQGGVDLDDGAVRAEQVPEPQGEGAQARPGHQDHVGLAHEPGRGVGAETAGDAQVPLAIEEVERQGGSGGQCAEPVGEFAELRAGAGEVRTAAGEDQRPLRPGEQAGYLPKAAVDVVRHLRCLRRRKVLVRSLECREVVGDGKHDGGAPGECVLHRLPGDGARGVAGDGEGGRAEARGDGRLVHVPGPGAAGGGVPGDQHHGDLRLDRLGEGGERVGVAGAVGGGARGEPSRRPVVGVGRGDGGALVPDGGEAEALLLRGVQEVDVAVAHDAEDVADIAAENLCHAAGDGESSHAGIVWPASHSWQYRRMQLGLLAAEAGRSDNMPTCGVRHPRLSPKGGIPAPTAG